MNLVNPTTIHTMNLTFGAGTASVVDHINDAAVIPALSILFTVVMPLEVSALVISRGEPVFINGQAGAVTVAKGTPVQIAYQF
jgi:hypothetical protein